MLHAKRIPVRSAWRSRLRSSRAALLCLKSTRSLSQNVREAPQEGKATSRTQFEDWMVNIRGENWLKGPRNPNWYTGKPPVHGICPGVDKAGHLRSSAIPRLDKMTRQIAQDYFDNSWTLVETLFSGLNGEDAFYAPPLHGLRHPQIFYYGHTPCLYVNKFRIAGLLDGPVNEYYESIFEVGVDEMSWDDMHKNDMVWPLIEDVKKYRKQVYDAVSTVIQEHPSLDDNNGKNPVNVTWDHPMWALFMGIEHERIHLETSSVLFREMPLKYVQTPQAWPPVHPSVLEPSAVTNPVEGVDYPKNENVEVKGGEIELGKPREFPSHGWDNEYGHRAIKVDSFSASKYMITNGEFWHFVAAGGYRDEKYWTEEGWGWRKFRNAKWPSFWELHGPHGLLQFKLRTIFASHPIQWSWPVDLNLHEASAYSNWKSEQDGIDGKPEAYRLITEAEHNIIRGPCVAEVRKDPYADRAMWANGEEFTSLENKGGGGPANLNMSYGSQSPVGSLPPSRSGHYDTMGNAWEWTLDHFSPLEGFKLHTLYEDFSTPCFDGRHHVIQGGSFMSTGAEASVFARFHFRPHFLQHSGFRIVSSKTLPPKHVLVADEEKTDNIYETDELIDQYLGMHYGQDSTSTTVAPIFPHLNSPDHALLFPQRVARLLKTLSPPSARRVLDVGCAVGGSAFELATSFDEVVAFDFSSGFIETAQRMQTEHSLPYRIRSEGELFEEAVAVLPSTVDATARGRVAFHVGDACKLVEDAKTLGTFDGVMLANLLCRLPEPLKCLDGLQKIVNPGGVVVFATPFSWLEDFTEKDRWIGGYTNPGGEVVASKDVLLKEMESRGFVKIHEEQMPFLIREHQRKYQYVVSEATGWRFEG